jgi:hypothetical protein
MVAEPVPPEVQAWADERAAARARRDYAAADALRARIEAAGWRVTDTAQGPLLTAAPGYETVTPAQVQDRSEEPDGHAASVLLLLEDHAGHVPVDVVVDDAARCLAGVLAHSQGHDYEIVILDNAVGGDAAEWAVDAAANPGIHSVHLAEPVGFAQARALQHRLATGRVLVWLDTGVEFTGDVLSPLLAAFDDASVGAAGRWGAEIGHSVWHFDAVEPGAEPADVHAVWGYLLALRRALVTDAVVTPDESYRFYRNADADVSLQVRAAGARAVVLDLPATQHVHRGYSATPADVVERESKRNYRRLLDRWRPVMEQLRLPPPPPRPYT